MSSRIVNRLVGWITAAMLVASFLLAVGLLSFLLYAREHDYHSHVVLTGSMVPKLPIGSLVVTQTTPVSDIHVGDIITFHPADEPNMLISHRVIAIVSESSTNGAQQRYFLTKGDANPVRDSWRVPISGSVERERFDLPYIGFLMVWLQSRIGRLMFLIGPALLLAVLFLLEIWKPSASGAQPSVVTR